MFHTDKIASQPSFDSVPTDVLVIIMSMLDLADLLAAALTSRRFALSVRRHWQLCLHNKYNMSAPKNVNIGILYNEMELLLEYAMINVAASVEQAVYHGKFYHRELEYSHLDIHCGTASLASAKKCWEKPLSLPDDLKRPRLLLQAKRALVSFMTDAFSMTPTEWDAHMMLGAQLYVGYDLKAYSISRVPYATLGTITIQSSLEGLSYRLYNDSGLVEGVIPWMLFPDTLPHDINGILANKQIALQVILTYTSSRNQTIAYQQLFDDCTLDTRHHNRQDLLTFGPVSTSFTPLDNETSFNLSRHGKQPLCRDDAIYAAMLSSVLFTTVVLKLNTTLRFILSKHPQLINYPLRLHGSESLLNLAIYKRHTETIKLLLDSGANVNFKSAKLSYFRWDTHHLFATLNEDISPLVLLIAYSSYYLDNNQMADFEWLVNALLERGADINLPCYNPITDENNKTPRQICEALLEMLTIDNLTEQLNDKSIPESEFNRLFACLEKIKNHLSAVTPDIGHTMHHPMRHT